jgi:hypothetical protein
MLKQEDTGHELPLLVGAFLPRLLSVVSDAMSAASCPVRPKYENSEERDKERPNVNSRTTIDDFHIVKPLSKGAYGKVYLARKIATGDLFAIKVLRKHDMLVKNMAEQVRSTLYHTHRQCARRLHPNPDAASSRQSTKREEAVGIGTSTALTRTRGSVVAQVLAERNILCSTHSPFVSRCFYSFTSETNLYMVMEYHNGGDMSTLLHGLGCLEEDMARVYVAETVLALVRVLYLSAPNFRKEAKGVCAELKTGKGTKHMDAEGVAGRNCRRSTSTHVASCTATSSRKTCSSAPTAICASRTSDSPLPASWSTRLCGCR